MSELGPNKEPDRNKALYAFLLLAHKANRNKIDSRYPDWLGVCRMHYNTWADIRRCVDSMNYVDLRPAVGDKKIYGFSVELDSNVAEGRFVFIARKEEVLLDEEVRND